MSMLEEIRQIAVRALDLATRHAQLRHQGGGEDSLAYAETADLQDVAATADQGDDFKVARGKHRHAHGSGYLPDAHHARSHDHSNASDGTTLVPLIYRLPAATELTISSGSVVRTQSHHTIDTENDTASDELASITGGSIGDLCVLHAANAARTVRVINGIATNAIVLEDGRDAVLDTDTKIIVLAKLGALWVEIDRNFPHVDTKGITIENPTASEDITIPLRSPRAVTIVEVSATVVGSATPSVTIDIKHSTDRSAAGTSILNAATAITNTTTGQTPTLATLANRQLVANSALWLETTAQSGTVDELSISITYIDGGA